MRRGREVGREAGREASHRNLSKYASQLIIFSVVPLSYPHRMRNNQGHSCIHKAAWRGRKALLLYLLEEGGMEREEFFKADENGYKPEDIAKLGGQEEVVKWLRELEKEV